MTACIRWQGRMGADFLGHDRIHLLGDSATHPIAPLRPRLGFAAWFHQKGTEYSQAGIGFGKRTAQTIEEAKMKNRNIGSDFDDFLADEGMLEEVSAVAVKRVIAWQIEQEMSAQKITKTAMAKKMRTSRASLNRLLDENDTSLTLTTLAGAAAALGQRIKLELTPV